MALLPQRLTRLSLYEQTIITIQRLTFEVLPFGASADDYEIEAHTFSAYGTSTDGILYLRRPKRLVVAKSKKPQKAVVLRKAWPDPRDAKEVASFHRKHLASQQDTPLQTSTPTLYTRPPQSVSGTLTAGVKAHCLIASGKTPTTSNRIPRCAMPRPRFRRHANEA